MTWWQRLLAWLFPPLPGTPGLPTRRQVSRDALFQMGFDLSGALDARYLIIHHSEGPASQTVEAITRYHVTPKPEGRGFNAVAYNALVREADGNVTIDPGRPLNKIGQHTIGFNDNAFAFCAIGNFDHEAPSEAMWTALVRVTSLFQDAFDIPTERVLGHRETYALRGVEKEKWCPGSRWDMEIFRRNCAARRLI